MVFECNGGQYDGTLLVLPKGRFPKCDGIKGNVIWWSSRNTIVNTIFCWLKLKAAEKLA